MEGRKRELLKKIGRKSSLGKKLFWNELCSCQNSYVEAPASNVAIFRDKVIKEAIKIAGVLIRRGRDSNNAHAQRKGVVRTQR